MIESSAVSASASPTGSSRTRVRRRPVLGIQSPRAQSRIVSVARVNASSWWQGPSSIHGDSQTGSRPRARWSRTSLGTARARLSPATVTRSIAGLPCFVSIIAGSGEAMGRSNNGRDRAALRSAPCSKYVSSNSYGRGDASRSPIRRTVSAAKTRSSLRTSVLRSRCASSAVAATKAGVSQGSKALAGDGSSSSFRAVPRSVANRSVRIGWGLSL